MTDTWREERAKEVFAELDAAVPERFYIHDDAEVRVKGAPVRVVKNTHTGEYYFSSTFIYPYANAREVDIPRPQRMLKPGASAVDKWVKYVLAVEAEVRARHNERAEAIGAFLGELETLADHPAVTSHSIQPHLYKASLITEHLQFQAEWSTGHISQSLRVRHGRENIETFKNLIK